MEVAFDQREGEVVVDRFRLRMPFSAFRAKGVCNADDTDPVQGQSMASMDDPDGQGDVGAISNAQEHGALGEVHLPIQGARGPVLRVQDGVEFQTEVGLGFPGLAQELRVRLLEGFRDIGSSGHPVDGCRIRRQILS
jgi:hypothetical protein